MKYKDLKIDENLFINDDTSMGLIPYYKFLPKFSFPSDLKEAHTFHDCIAFKCHTAHYLLIKFRDDLLKVRIKKSYYEKIIKNDPKNKIFNA